MEKDQWKEYVCVTQPPAQALCDHNHASRECSQKQSVEQHVRTEIHDRQLIEREHDQPGKRHTVLIML